MLQASLVRYAADVDRHISIHGVDSGSAFSGNSMKEAGERPDGSCDVIDGVKERQAINTPIVSSGV